MCLITFKRVVDNFYICDTPPFRVTNFLFKVPKNGNRTSGEHPTTSGPVFDRKLHYIQCEVRLSPLRVPVPDRKWHFRSKSELSYWSYLLIPWNPFLLSVGTRWRGLSTKFKSLWQELKLFYSLGRKSKVLLKEKKKKRPLVPLLFHCIVT